jgi:16S rRNA (adenine(1408)-N(1))-methyltransferase
MAEASRRAARSPAKGGLPNARFVVAAAEVPPRDLVRRVDRLTIHFPWGSLLRGVLARDEAVASGIAALLMTDGELAALLAPAGRDVLRDLPTVTTLLEPLCTDDLRRRWAGHGLQLVEARAAAVDEVDEARSTWARRLRAGRDPERPVARLLFRPADGASGRGRA